MAYGYPLPSEGIFANHGAFNDPLPNRLPNRLPTGNALVRRERRERSTLRLNRRGGYDQKAEDCKPTNDAAHGDLQSASRSVGLPWDVC